MLQYICLIVVRIAIAH